MNKIFFAAFLLLINLAVFSQKVPRFQKYDVLDSEFKLYMPSSPSDSQLAYSQDSSRVYTIECIDSTAGKIFHFGAIIVCDLQISGSEEDITISYLDFLKQDLKIQESAGYGKGHTLATHTTTFGVIDFWKDSEGNEWKIKAFADPKSIVVMYVYGPVEYPVYNITEIFFSGIRFPGD